VQPDTRRNEVIGFIKGGLRDFSMSRVSLSWGVPLPWDEKHVAYVWSDALVNYLTAIGYGTDRERFDRYWPAQYHLIGKDILRFHAVYWPAMLFAAGEAPPRCVFAHGWLQVGGEKMSKSGGTQIAPADLVAEFGVDGYRYHFLADQRFGPDGDFSYEAMVTRYNADLANNFGNLASRVLNMAVSYCGGVAPEQRSDGLLAAASVRALESTQAAMDRLDFSGACSAVWDLIRAANAFIEESEPWKLNKAGDTDATAAVLGDCVETLRIVALLASPFIPRATSELWRRLGLDGDPTDQRLPEAAGWGLGPRGTTLDKGAPLFPRIEPSAS
jgi:methionyl-tRNA synthetase